MQVINMDKIEQVRKVLDAWGISRYRDTIAAEILQLVDG